MEIKMKSKIFRTVILIASTSIVFVSCGAGNQILSTKKNSPIVIDGNYSDWNNSLTYYEEERSAVGVQNDDEYLYVCISTADQSKIMKMIGMGVTVWLEPVDGKTIGIRYPFQKDKTAMLRRPGNIDLQTPQMMQQNQQQERGADNMLKQRVEQLMMEQRELLIVNEDNYSLYAYPIDEKYGFQVAIGTEMGQIYYELRIPLALNDMAPIVFNAYANDIIELTFETNELDISEKQENASRDSGNSTGGSGGRGGGGRGGGGGGRGGGGGKGGGGMTGSGSSSDPFSITLKITLAE